MATSTTTNYSFPYPLGSDSLSNVALRIQQLAEYIDSTYTILGVDLSSNAAFIQTGDAAGGNLTGTYPNPTISTSVVLPDGTFAVTQSQYDGSTKLATTSYVDTAAFNFTLGTIPPLSVTNAMLAGSITYAKLILTNSIVNADVATGAAIDKTKISGTAVTLADTGTVTSTMLLDGTILNADVNASAAIAYSKLNLGTSIVNADISATAAIVDTKLATISTASKVSNSATTATSANTASAIVARDASGNFTAGMITANVTGALTGNASTVTTNANLTGDVTSVGNATSIASGVIVNADVNASAAISYSKLNLATSIVNADVSASAAIAYSKLALTGAILNADLAGSIAPAKITGTAVVTADSRLSDARTPTAHASTHIPGGTDVLTFSAFSGQGSSLPGSLTLYPAGSLFAVGTAAPYLIYRSNGTSWDQLGASAITTSDTAPATPQAGDLWYQSSTGKQFIYYDSFWVEMGNNTNASVSTHASSHASGGSDAISIKQSQINDFVFTTEAARDAAITSPTEGMQAYLTAPTVPAATGTTTAVPTGIQTIYNGSNWVCITPIGTHTSVDATVNSTSYTQSLSTGTNPTVTITTGTTALVQLGGYVYNDSANRVLYIGFAVSGATTLAASDTNATFLAQATAQWGGTISRSIIITGLTAGTNTFALSYRSDSSGVSHFANKTLVVQGIA